MVTEIKESLTKVIILNISGVYAQIYNQGYFTYDEVAKIQRMYSDRDHWKVIIFDK